MRFRHLVILFLIAGQLLLLEVTFEFRAHRRGWPSLLFSKPEVDVKRENSHFKRNYGPIKGFPFRSPVVAKEREDSVLRLWVASSSMGEHIRLSPEKIFPNKLRELIESKGQKCEVINASKAGNSIVSNIKTLETLGPKWTPDVVILYNMSNDITGISKKLFLHGISFNARQEEDKPRFEETKPILQIDLWEKTTLYSHLQTLVTSHLAQFRVLHDSLGWRGEREFEDLLQRYFETCKKLGARPIICTFATSHVRNQLPKWPNALKKGLLRYNIYLSPKGWASTIEAFNALIIEFAAKNEIQIIDVSKIMAGNSDFFIDFVHFSPKGHLMLAKALSEAITSSF